MSMDFSIVKKLEGCEIWGKGLVIWDNGKLVRRFPKGTYISEFVYSQYSQTPYLLVHPLTFEQDVFIAPRNISRILIGKNINISIRITKEEE